MDVDLFAFDLPQSLIAVRPVRPRNHSKLLIVDPKGDGNLFTDSQFFKLGDYLKPGDCLVFNDAKVIPAQLHGVRDRAGNRANFSLTLHQCLSDQKWAGFAKGAKKLKINDDLVFDDPKGGAPLTAKVLDKSTDGQIIVGFDMAGDPLMKALHRVGTMPLPPYIASKRHFDAQDNIDYQTVYSQREGAVAAPTAGLHFTDAMLDDLKAQGIHCVFATLLVGAGTFLPVKANDTNDHVMHSETGMIDGDAAEIINQTKAQGGRVICVGTTALRLLESAVDATGKIAQWSGSTDIFITPGYRFKIVDGLITNFHLPRSTLFMLVSAFSGLDVMQQAYNHAINQEYRFFSYGDASLLFPKREAPLENQSLEGGQ